MWIWPVLLFQSNVADVLHCFFFTRHYHHETNREQASTSHSIPPETPSVPSLKQQVAPHPEFGDLCWSLVWHQLKSSPPFPTGGGLRRPLGVPYQFSFQVCKRKVALGCLFFTVVLPSGRNCISSWGSILAIPSYPNKGSFCGRDLRPWTGEQRSGWGSPSALGRDSKPWPLHQQLLVPGAGAGLHQAVAPLSWAACKQHPCQRWFAKPSDRLRKRKKLKQNFCCQLHNQILFL